MIWAARWASSTRDVEVGDGSYDVGADGTDEHPFVTTRRNELCRIVARDDHDVCVDPFGVDACSLGDQPGIVVVVGEAFEVVVQRVQAGCREWSGLPPPCSQALAPHPRLGDLVARPEHQRPDRRTETFGQAHGCGVGDTGEVGQGDPGADVGVPDAGTVEMDADASAVRELAEPGQPWCRLHSAAGEVVGVLDGDRRGGDEERPEIGRDQGLERIKIDVAVGVGPGPHGQPGEGAVGTELGPGDMGGGLAEDLLPRTYQRPDGEEVGQRPGDGEQRSLEAEEVGDPFLQRPDGRVLAVHVVTDLSPAHGGAHGLSRASDGVASQIDHGRSL